MKLYQTRAEHDERVEVTEARFSSHLNKAVLTTEQMDFIIIFLKKT